MVGDALFWLSAAVGLLICVWMAHAEGGPEFGVALLAVGLAGAVMAALGSSLLALVSVLLCLSILAAALV